MYLAKASSVMTLKLTLCIPKQLVPFSDNLFIDILALFSGFTGLNCETQILECASSPCSNGANCMDEIGGFTCICPRGIGGKTGLSFEQSDAVISLVVL